MNNADLWYRSVLQVILLEKFFVPVVTDKEEKTATSYINKLTGERILATNIQVGRNLINNKNSSPLSFCEYVRKALNKLNFNELVSLLILKIIQLSRK